MTIRGRRADVERGGPSPWGLLLLVAIAALLVTGHWTLVVAVLGLALLIFVHELGHFLAAKAFGMRVERFYIGFPPAVVRRPWGETEYGVGVDPAGRLLQDLRHDARREAARRRRAARLLEQAGLAAQRHHRAGPFMNFVAASSSCSSSSRRAGYPARRR